MQDEVMKTGKWEFDKDVAEVFDDMLSRSIPNYNNMRELIYKVGSKFCQNGETLIDIGCSLGKSFDAFAKDGTNIIGIEVSKPMIDAAKNEYKNYKNVSIIDMDITKELPKENANLILSILTLQFTPIEYRFDIVKRIYDNLNNGGAFILVEKVLGNTAKMDKILTETYYEIKTQHQYTQEQIANKRKSLEGVLVPLTSNWNEELLKNSGFSMVDSFWRNCNFAGWIAIK